MKIFITGATGFVGACLAENLAGEGHELSTVVRAGSNKWRLSRIIKYINILDVDLCDEFKLNTVIKEIKPEIVFHLAAYGGYHFEQETSKIINTNFTGTVNLVTACSSIDYKAFVNVGSSSEYGIKSSPLKETDVLEPINTYGIAKASAALYCQMIAKTQNKPIVTVRLFSPYGYYEDKTRLVPSVVLPCLKGENPELSSPNAVRDFIFIDDVIEMLKVISRHDKISSNIYNCGSGKQHSVAEMVDAIIEQSGANVTPVWGSVAGRQSDSAQKWEADMSFVKKELGWQPEYTLEEGIKKTIEWYRENINLYIDNHL